MSLWAISAQATSLLVVQPSASGYDATDNQKASALKARANANSSGLEEGATTRVEIVLQMQPSTAALDVQSSAGLAARIQAVTQQVQNFRQSYSSYFPATFESAAITPYIDADITAAGIDALMLDSSVVSISEPVFFRESLLQTNTLLQTSLLPPVSAGSLGNNMVAIIDSGVADHPAFQQRIVAGGCSSSSLNNLPSICNVEISGGPCRITTPGTPAATIAALSNCGHGTHVAGIAASSSATAGASGMLPSAGILRFQASSLRANPSNNLPVRTYRTFDIKRGLEFAFANRALNGRKLAAVNMSFGMYGFTDSEGYFPSSYECNGGLQGDEVLQTIVEVRRAIVDLRNANVSVVAATGNEIFGMAFPACALDLNPVIQNQQRTVVAVAATRKDSSPAGYASLGFDPSFVATVFAPGGDTGETVASCLLSGSATGVCSTGYTPSTNATSTEHRSGTSMAAPHAAGLLARLSDRFPNSTRAQRESALVSSGIQTAAVGTGVGVFPVPFNTSIPRINGFAAFRQASVPSNVVAPSATCRALTWGSPSVLQATGYRVRSASSETGLSNATAINAGNVLTFSFPQNGFAQVLAFDAQGDGAWSSAVALNSSACAPAAVANFRASTTAPAGTSGCFHGVEWNPTGGATEYRLEEVCLGGSPSGVEAIAATRLYKRLQRSNHTSCTAGDKANYRVQACNSGDCGPWSAVVQQTPVLLACSFTD